MAKKEKTASASGEAKTRKAAKVRTDAQLLQMGVKGNVFLVVRKAYGLGTKNGFAGTTRQAAKFPNGILYLKGKDGGSYWKLSEEGDSFKGIRSAAKSALSDLQAMKYTDSVKKLIDAFAAAGEGGRGSRTMSVESLKSVSL